MTSHACHLVAAAVPERDRPPLPCEPVEALCAVTGTAGPCLPREAAITESNCDSYLFASPTSRWVHVDVFISWNFGELKPGAKRKTCPERQACWWCGGDEFLTVTKPFMRHIVLAGRSPTCPWAMWVTTSYKKHGTVRTPVNHSRWGRIGFDELVVDCSSEAEIGEYWRRLRGALDAGMPRPLIENLDCSPAFIAKLGWRVWRDFEAWARPRVRSPLYTFLTYLLPSREELKNEAAACAS